MLAFFYQHPRIAYAMLVVGISVGLAGLVEITYQFVSAWNRQKRPWL